MTNKRYEIIYGKDLAARFYIEDELNDRLGMEIDVLSTSDGVLIRPRRPVKGFPVCEYSQEMLSDPDQLVEMYVMECVFS
jgi:hypothetical protein